MAESSEDRKGKGRAEPSPWPPTHINATVATRALEEFQSHWLERRGDCNVPLIFLKQAKWFDQDGADGYYCQYKDEGWKHVEFSFEFLVWVNIRIKDHKYLAWQIAHGPLEITQEERAIPRSDWGPIDGAAEPSSEPENIKVREPQSDTSDGDKSDDEDIVIPTEASTKAKEAIQVLFHELKTDDLPISIPQPHSWNTRIPSITAIMATATQTTHAPTIGRSSGGGGSGPSGSGGGLGGGPPGGAGGPPGGGGGGGRPLGGGAGPGLGQAAGGAKLVGNPPQTFDGERKRTQLFLLQWEIYWGLNYQVDIMAQPYSQVLCFLSYIQGPEVQDWVMHELQWLCDQVHSHHVLPNNPWLWAQMMVHFGNAFIDTMTQAKACHKLTKLRMEGGHIDEYIAKFERYVTMAGYGVNEPTVLEKFIKGLPNPLARNCVEMDNPNSWDKWKESARKRQEVYLKWRQILGVSNTKKDQSPSKKRDLNRWRQGFNSKRTEKDPNAMDTTPGRTRARRMTTEE